MLPNCINIRKYIAIIIILIGVNFLSGQDVFNIDKAVEMALKHQKLNGQRALITDKKDTEIKLLKKQRLPQIDWTAQATLQSENIDLEFPVPNIPSISLPLYKANTDLEANYMLYDGGITDEMVENKRIMSELDLSNIDNQLFQIKSKIVDLYFSIITLGHQKTILDSSYHILTIKEKMISTAIANGVALKSDMDKLKIEEIKVKNNIAKLISNRKTLIKVLEDMTGADLKGKEFLSPLKIEYADDWTKRPEYKSFDLTYKLLDQGKKLIIAKRKPKVVLFAKAGIGYPNPFNFFDDNIAAYGLGGIKFVWNFWDWGKSNLERQKLEIDKSIVNNKKDVFDEGLKIEKNKIESQIQGLEQNLHFNEELIKKQMDLIETLENQYKNGVATINDLLVEITKKSISEINLAIDKVAIDKLKYKLKTLLGQ
ncbi:MAG TPA: TolC family protein [Bacteroidetes bacterium]|nr:TolC family protein [Bacteroidota bacterium]